MSNSRDYEIDALDAKAKTAFNRWFNAPEGSETQSQAYAEYEKYSNQARALINAPEKQTTPSSTGWADGVIAKYLTVSGATVDIGEFNAHNRRPVTCNGCGSEEHFNGDPCLFGLEINVRDRNSLKECKQWAQTHAETCRALPRPEQETAS